MKMNIESSSQPEPRVSILEKDASKKAGKFPAHPEMVSGLAVPADPATLNKAEYDGILSEARQRSVNNDAFIVKLVSAMAEKSEERRSVRRLAEIENSLVEICANLADRDIDSLLAQLRKKCINYIYQNKGLLNVSPKSMEDMHRGKWDPNAAGIKSVVHFLRGRTSLLTKEPAQRFVIGFNNHLDVDQKIDLMEIIFGETELDIEQLSFVQIKSKPPTEEELAQLTYEHQEYVRREMMNLGEIEELELPKEEEKRLFEETLSNQAIMFDKIFEICLDYENTRPMDLLSVLGLSKLSSIQRAWVLNTYLGTIIEQITQACEEGYVSERSKDLLVDDMEYLLKKLIKETGLPLKLARINRVNSIIAVGAKIVKQTEIFRSGSQKEKLAATI